MSYSLTITDFYTDYITANPTLVQRTNFSETINMLPANSVNGLTVYYGTFNLKDRVQTWQGHEAELRKACTTKHTIKRVVVTLLAVAVITAAVAVMVFGGDIGFLVGGAAILLSTYLAKKTVQKEAFGKVIPGVFFPFSTLSTPIFFAYAVATYRSRRAKKVASSKKEAVAVANYVLANHTDISAWLEQQKKETSSKLYQEKTNLLTPGMETRFDRIALDVIKTCLDDLDKIEGWTKNLAESVTEARNLLQANLAP